MKQYKATITYIVRGKPKRTEKIYKASCIFDAQVMATRDHKRHKVRAVVVESCGKSPFNQ